MGEARRRGTTAPTGPTPFVRGFEAGERDMTVGEIVARGHELFGGLANTFVETNFAEKQRDPLTGVIGYPKRFCVGRFLTEDDRELPSPKRRQEILGRGTSWAEAFARAAERLRQ